MSISSQTLADHILFGFGGPSVHVRPVTVQIEQVPVPAAPAVTPTRQNKFAAKGDQIDEALLRLIKTRKPGQTFSQDEIAQACGCHRRNIQFIEKRAIYKFTRRLLVTAPQLVAESLGDGVSMADILRIHHPSSSDSGNSQRKETDFRWQKRARRNLGQFESTERNTYETVKMLRAREPNRPYGRKPSPQQLAEIRAERMRRNKEAANVL
jgi:hypothetical protein